MSDSATPIIQRTMSAPQTITESSIVRFAVGQVSSQLGEEVVILGLDSNRYFGLDEVGATVWNLLKEPRSVTSIRNRLLEEYDVDPQVCQQDLIALLQELAEHQLIEITHEASD